MKQDRTLAVSPPQTSTWAMEQGVGSGVGTTQEGTAGHYDWVEPGVGGHTASHCIER